MRSILGLHWRVCVRKYDEEHLRDNSRNLLKTKGAPKHARQYFRKEGGGYKKAANKPQLSVPFAARPRQLTRAPGQPETPRRARWRGRTPSSAKKNNVQTKRWRRGGGLRSPTGLFI